MQGCDLKMSRRGGAFCSHSRSGEYQLIVFIISASCFIVCLISNKAETRSSSRITPAHDSNGGESEKQRERES